MNCNRTVPVPAQSAARSASQLPLSIARIDNNDVAVKKDLRDPTHATRTKGANDELSHLMDVRKHTLLVLPGLNPRRSSPRLLFAKANRPKPSTLHHLPNPRGPCLFRSGSDPRFVPHPS